MGILLLYIESTGGLVSKTNLPAISAALKAKITFGNDRVVGLLMGGSGTAEAAKSISGFGLDEVLVIEDPLLEKYNAVVFSKAFSKVVNENSPSHVFSIASARGKDFIPRVAAMHDSPQASDVVDFVKPGVYRRPIYAGNIIADVELEGGLHFATLRGSAFDQPITGSQASIRNLTITVEADETMEVVSFDTVKSERPELGEADIIVSGGRALKSSENFESVIFPLADILGAAVGASRAAVDSGYAPNDWQVGQTGKIVAPKLYIAVGISGAVQHLAGMKDSKVIVAINKDPDAPIFEVADYGLVADLFEAVPEMVKAIKG